MVNMHNILDKKNDEQQSGCRICGMVKGEIIGRRIVGGGYKKWW